MAALQAINNNTISFQLNFTDCPIGFYFSKLQFQGIPYGICIPCYNGTFLIEPTPFQRTILGPCDQCDYELCNTCGQAYLHVKPGVWRFNATADILMICPAGFSCPGGDPYNNTNFSSYACAENYLGNLCNKCAPGFGKFGTQAECFDCNQNWTYYAILVGTVVFQIIMLCYSVYSTLQGNLKVLSGPEARKSVLMKILSNYTDLMTFLSAVHIVWPPSIQQMMQVNTYASPAMVQQSGLSSDCVIDDLTNADTPLLYVKVLVTLTAPYGVAVLAFFIWSLIFKIKKRQIRGNKDFATSIITTIIIIVYSWYPALIKSTFTLFQCQNLYRKDTPIYYLENEYDVECYTGGHLVWALGVGLTNVGIWGVAVPCLMYYVLRKNRDCLGSPEVKAKYSYLYNGYSSSRYYWEIVILARKFLIVANLVFIESISLTLQTLLAMVVVSIYALVFVAAEPYQESDLNKLDILGVCSAYLFSFMAVYYTDPKNREYYVDWVILCLVLATNILYILSWLYLFLKTMKQAKAEEAALKKLATLKEKEGAKQEKPKIPEDEILSDKQNEGLVSITDNETNSMDELKHITGKTNLGYLRIQSSLHNPIVLKNAFEETKNEFEEENIFMMDASPERGTPTNSASLAFSRMKSMEPPSVDDRSPASRLQ
jgi:hypothetical protein